MDICCFVTKSLRRMVAFELSKLTVLVFALMVIAASYASALGASKSSPCEAKKDSVKLS